MAAMSAVSSLYKYFQRLSLSFLESSFALLFTFLDEICFNLQTIANIFYQFNEIFSVFPVFAFSFSSRV